MRRRVVAALLTVSMTAALLPGCGNGAAEEGAGGRKPVQEGDTEAEDGADADDGAEDEEDLAEITVSFWSLAGVPDEENKAMVEDAINEVTEAQINTTVHLNIMDVGSYIPNGAMANGVANGEDFDLVITAAALSGHYSVMMSNGMLLPITDLLEEYAPELMATVPEEFFAATTRDGEIYAVPSYCNKVQSMWWLCRDAALEQAGIEIETVKTVDDLDAALHAIKEKTEYIPMGGASFTMNMTYPGYSYGAGNTAAMWDPLGESTAVVAAVYNDDDTHTAVSRYETEDFRKDMEYLKKWYDEGLLDRDTATDSATGSAIIDKDDVASEIFVAQFDNAGIRSAASGASYVKLADGVVGTGAMQQFTWAVPVSCDEPEAAVKFMNLVFTNADIVNLLNYGVEGVHYEKKADGTIGFPEGVTADNSGYYLGTGLVSLIGNGFLALPWEGSDPGNAQRGLQEMNNATYSPLMGFALDTAALGDTYTALCPIANQEYGPALFCGSAPDGYYEEFIQKMKDAGLEEYLAKVNEQIQDWLAQQ